MDLDLVDRLGHVLGADERRVRRVEGDDRAALARPLDQLRELLSRRPRRARRVVRRAKRRGDVRPLGLLEVGEEAVLGAALHVHDAVVPAVWKHSKFTDSSKKSGAWSGLCCVSGDGLARTPTVLRQSRPNDKRLVGVQSVRGAQGGARTSKTCAFCLFHVY